MASSSCRRQIEKKFLDREQVRNASVMISLGNAKWSGTIIGQKDNQTLVLSVAHTFATVPWMSRTQMEELLGVYFAREPNM